MTGKHAIGARVLDVARGWIGTPYRHQASAKGVGCDCLGLVRGIWRELYGSEPEPLPAYGRDWAGQSGAEDRLNAAALRHFIARPSGAEAEPGDLLLFRWRPHMPASHCGILIGDGRFIHAYEKAAVLASPLAPGWARRICGLFRFPDL
ncbi:peptidase P60 [Xaviernesmea oryzae]|uniref:Peptidase P60 n=1 Tax=Xaviernesmea oryzae TaxID=464029 RepID=A0A1Q9B1F9_9HYPH|nr:NlpC/P60 family protein [Xaviernesmea oryzae]OLP61859.1 peptidase P60 [Xaviernesmea oryzae]SEL75202.1 putative phage cell wall peptidase, NlpC/P60 family [Xaviernesmea oryzae]